MALRTLETRLAKAASVPGHHRKGLGTAVQDKVAFERFPLRGRLHSPCHDSCKGKKNSDRTAALTTGTLARTAADRIMALFQFIAIAAWLTRRTRMKECQR
jgi:hypothetical protein